jgi:hypothetical protein
MEVRDMEQCVPAKSVSKYLVNEGEITSPDEVDYIEAYVTALC